MTVHGYELQGEWKNSTCGKRVAAKRGGKIYFLKKYQTPVHPTMEGGALDAKTFAANKKKFEDYVAYRKKVNETLRPLAGPGGNIIIPQEEFVDDNHYTEASELVPNIVPDEDYTDVLSRLSAEDKDLLMRTAAGALMGVHSKGVVHSDLKLTNVLLVKNSAGKYVAKLIDFDGSYLVAEKVEYISGDINYFSPELGIFMMAEDGLDELLENLSEKSDIFSLGLIYHVYLTGHLPEPKSLTDKLQRRRDKGKVVYCWTVLNHGCELVVDESITSPKYRSLITDMLKLDPAERPTATQVLQRLRAADAPAPAPAPRPTPTPAPAPAPAPASIVRGFCEPWPEHGIAFDTDRLTSRSYVGAARVDRGGQHGYELYREGAPAVFFTKEKLVMMLLAKKAGASASAPTPAPAPAPSPAPAPAPTPAPAAVEGGYCEPWPEDGILLDTAALAARGWVRVDREERGGVRGYLLSPATGVSRFLNAQKILLMGLGRRA